MNINILTRLHKDNKEQEHEVRRVSQVWKSVVDIERRSNEAVSKHTSKENTVNGNFSRAE